MATLSETSSNTKKIVFGCLVFIVLAISWTIFSRFLSTKPVVLQTGEVLNCEVINGLSELKIPSLSLAEGSLPKFSLETQTGKLPTDLPKYSYVYEYQLPRQTLASRDEAINIAKSLGFSTTALEISNSKLKWTSVLNNRDLVIDKISKEVSISTDFTKKNDIKTTKPFSETQNIYESALLSYGLSTRALNDNYTNAKLTSVYAVYDSQNKLYKSLSPDRTQVSLINVYKRLALDPKLEYITSNQLDTSKFVDVLGNNPKMSDTRGIMGLDVNSQLYFFKSPNWYIKNTNLLLNTEEIKPCVKVLPVSEAWDKVQSGGASLVYLKKVDDNYIDTDYVPLDVETFFVLDIQLRFYESSEYQDYLQPIYVFTGNAKLKEGGNSEFVIYYPATNPY